MPRPPRGIYERKWISKKTRGLNGRPVKRSAYGYRVTINGKRVREMDQSWTLQDAIKARAERLHGVREEKPAPVSTMTLAAAIER